MSRFGAYAAPQWANSQRVGSVGAKAVLMLLAAYADEEFSCYPGQERIADETEQSVSTVRRQLKHLEDLGLFHRARRYAGQSNRKTDRYFLHLDVTVTLADVERLGSEERVAGVLSGGFPQVSAASGPLPVTVTGSGVSAGQALPVNLTGSAHYRSSGAPLPVTGDRLELLEELPDSDGPVDLDLTREPVSPELSTGPSSRVVDVRPYDEPRRRPVWAGPATPPAGGQLQEARALVAAAKLRSSSATPDRSRDGYLSTVTAYAGRDPEHRRLAAERLAPAPPAPPSEEPDATP